MTTTSSSLRGQGVVGIIAVIGLGIMPVVTAGVGCSFDRAGLPLLQDGAVPGDAQQVGDAAVTLDSQTQADAEPGQDAGPQQDAQVQPDAAPTCVPASCPLGCNLAEDRCNRIAPSNFSAQVFHDTLTNGINCAPGENIFINTGTGAIIGDITYRAGGNPQGQTVNGIYWNVVSQAGGPDLAVFGLTHLTIPDQCWVVVDGPHPAAFYVSGDVFVGGTLSGYGEQNAPGPGGGTGGPANGAPGIPCGGAPGTGGAEGGTGNNQYEAGGGGAGLGGNGGNGAYSTEGVADGGVGGVPVGVNLALTPLVAGCGGGAGGGPDTAGDGGAGGNGGYGGAGGGGLQISAGGTISLGATGGIDVGAGGGQGGQFGAGGGGGGSGGAILLEAAEVNNGGLLAANGGGGGAGGTSTTASGEDGDPGWLGTNASAGGSGQNFGGNGGTGGAAAMPNGTTAPPAFNGGGGGGSAGLIRLSYHSTANAGTTSPSSISQQQGIGLLW